MDKTLQRCHGLGKPQPGLLWFCSLGASVCITFQSSYCLLTDPSPAFVPAVTLPLQGPFSAAFEGSDWARLLLAGTREPLPVSFVHLLFTDISF